MIMSKSFGTAGQGGMTSNSWLLRGVSTQIQLFQMTAQFMFRRWNWYKTCTPLNLLGVRVHRNRRPDEVGVSGFHQSQRRMRPHPKAGYMEALLFSHYGKLFLASRGGPYMTPEFLNACLETGTLNQNGGQYV